jgi:hypothetical protein
MGGGRTCSFCSASIFLKPNGRRERSGLTGEVIFSCDGFAKQPLWGRESNLQIFQKPPLTQLVVFISPASEDTDRASRILAIKVIYLIT